MARLKSKPDDASFFSKDSDWISRAQARSAADLALAREMRDEAGEVSRRVRVEYARNHWAETIRRALGGNK